MQKNNCPICFQLLGPNPVCSGCGWKDGGASLPQSRGKKVHLSIIKSMTITSAAMLVMLFHFSKWGSESVNIVFLKTAQVIGFAGESQYASLVRICKKAGNYDCVESALKSQYKSSNSADHLKELALFQLKREKNQAAVQTYESYFQKNGTQDIDKQSAYNYAKLLEKVGQKEKALEYYETILSQRKKTEFPVSVVRSTVQLLVSLRRGSEAQSLVKEYKTLAEQDNYLQQEILKWEKTISGQI